MEKAREFIKNNKNKIIIGILVLVVVALPIIISQVLKQQNTQQHAESAPPISLTLSPIASTTITITPKITAYPYPYPNKPYVQAVSLTMDTGTNDIGSLQFTLKYDPSKIQFSSVSSDTFPYQKAKSLSQGNEQIILLNPTITQISGSNIKVATFYFTPTYNNYYTSTYNNHYPEMTIAPQSNDKIDVSIDSTKVQATATSFNTFVPVSSTYIGTVPQTTTTSPSVSPTLTITPSVSPTPTTALTPTPTPIPSPTPTLAPNETVIEGLILLPGISDNGGNKNPKHMTRKVYYQIFDSNNKMVNQGSQNATFTATPPMGGNPGFYARYSTIVPLPAGPYTAKIRMNNTLWKKLPMIISVKDNAVNTIGTETLVTGDFANTNSLDVSDYTLLIACYQNASSCTPDDKTATDLNDDGNVNEDDLNILQRGLAIRNGD